MFNTQSNILQADWLILDNDEKETGVNMPYYTLNLSLMTSHYVLNINEIIPVLVFS